MLKDFLCPLGEHNLHQSNSVQQYPAFLPKLLFIPFLENNYALLSLFVYTPNPLKHISTAQSKVIHQIKNKTRVHLKTHFRGRHKVKTLCSKYMFVIPHLDLHQR